MLTDLVKKYETNKKEIQRKIESLSDKVEEEIQAKTIRALKIQNHKITKIHSNQQEIQTRLKRNTQIQTQLKTQMQGWLNMYETLNKSMKQAGDLVNYAQYIQQEINEVSASLKKQEKGEQEEKKENERSDKEKIVEEYEQKAEEGLMQVKEKQKEKEEKEKEEIKEEEVRQEEGEKGYEQKQ